MIVGFEQDETNKKVYKNEKYTDNISVGILINEDSTLFKSLYNYILLEEAKELTCKIKVKNTKTNQEKEIDNIKISSDISKDKFNELIKTAVEKTNLMSNISSDIQDKLKDIDMDSIKESLNKLSDEEKNAIISFYSKGDKNSAIYKILTDLTNTK